MSRLPESPAFEAITEIAGIPLTPEGAGMLYTRYKVAANVATARRTLELGCGAGPGLGLLERKASVLVAGDYSWPLLSAAKGHYGQRVPLVQLSAEALPFANESFECILLFEASYYVPSMESAFDEMARVLSPGGCIMLVNANPERPDFIKSPHSIHYHSAGEFRACLAQRGFEATVEGAFPVHSARSLSARLVSRCTVFTRRFLARLHLVPKTLRGRSRLKRIIYGRKLTPAPRELTPDFAREASREPLPSGPAMNHKVLYVTAIRGRSRAMSSKYPAIDA